MSAAEGWNRRAMLTAAAATGLLAAAPAYARRCANHQFKAPDGTYQAITCTNSAGGWLSAGIRYARAKRFQAPKRITDAEQLPENRFGPVCPQSGSRYEQSSEDCLFLNVWTPSYSPAEPKPVMIYFHGGAYSTGSVTDPLNDGAALAARGDVVVVTVNHRLNALGYLYLARLDPRFPDSGNAGQLDLILALQWV
jgi:para-nitrobenzyl esterase